MCLLFIQLNFVFQSPHSFFCSSDLIWCNTHLCFWLNVVEWFLVYPTQLLVCQRLKPRMYIFVINTLPNKKSNKKLTTHTQKRFRSVYVQIKTHPHILHFITHGIRSRPNQRKNTSKICFSICIPFIIKSLSVHPFFMWVFYSFAFVFVFPVKLFILHFSFVKAIFIF